MGVALSRRQPKPAQVLLMGLDSSGKTSLMHSLLAGSQRETTPTVGFNVGRLELDKAVLTVWDVGGQPAMRPYWGHYLETCDGLVFVVDSSNRARMPEAHRALKKLLGDPNMSGVPLMVLANKADVPGAVGIEEVAELLKLASYEELDWEIQACSARTGLGLQQAFRSMAKLIKDS